MKLSIITINYNNSIGLRATFESISKQTCRDFEYIVIDGGSTDGSVDIIKEYSKYIKYWISEPDRGIYDAMNKGVRVATGTYCNFLNSGDKLNNTRVVDKFLKSDLKADIICGIERRIRPDGKYQDCIPPTEIITDIFITRSIGHGSSFIRRENLINNPYDETLKIVSDWKFFLEELLINNASYSAWNEIVNDFDMTGISNTQNEKMMLERNVVLESIIPPKILYDYLSLINGRTELEKMLHHERPGGGLEKILTFIARNILNISQLVKH